MVTAAFKNWVKGNTTMKLSSDAVVLRICKEGITAEEEKTNTAFIAALQISFAPAPLPPAPTFTPAVAPVAAVASTIASVLPAPSIKLTSIMRGGKC